MSLRIGLVLGGGGSVGVAYHGAILAALADATGWDPAAAEVVVGTSAGSLSGALIRVGLPATDLRNVSEDRPLSPAGAVMAERSQPHRPRCRATDFVGLRGCADVRGGLGGLRHVWRSPLATVAALLPSGPVSNDSIGRGFDLLVGDRWPGGPLWIPAVRLHDQHTVVFGRDADVEARLGQAVSASCAIPTYYAPVTIDGERYVDGGVTSMHHADLLAPRRLDLVVISAPMSYQGRVAPVSPVSVLRYAVRAQLAREVAQLRQVGTRVLVLAPGRRVIGAMGLDPMDARRRGPVSRMAYAEARSQLGSTPEAALLRRTASVLAGQRPTA